MRICYTNFHSQDGGGHTTYVLSLARSLAQRHDIWVIAPQTSRLYREAGRIPGVHRRSLPFSTSPTGSLRDAIALRALIRQEAFDLIHVNGSADHRCAMLASLLLRGKLRPRIVFTKHNDLPVHSRGNRMRARLATDFVICVSASVQDQLRHSPYERHELRVIRNGVDTAHYAPWDSLASRQQRSQWGIFPKDAFLIGSNAGVAPHKGWLDMVRAVASLPDALRNRVFVLLAGQPFSPGERAEIAALGMSERVIHAGLLHDVRPFIAALDMGFVLSHRIETISFACREMMAMGKPVVVSDAGGLPENITPGVDGWIVPRQTPAAVTAVLREALAEDASRLAAMGQAARVKSVAEFGLDRFVQETERVYLEICGCP
jgi:glycosyltransferase involved in cell wall biosynthesis